MENINVSINKNEAIDIIRAIDMLVSHEMTLGRLGKIERLISIQTNLQSEVSEVA